MPSSEAWMKLGGSLMQFGLGYQKLQNEEMRNARLAELEQQRIDLTRDSNISEQKLSRFKEGAMLDENGQLIEDTGLLDSRHQRELELAEQRNTYRTTGTGSNGSGSGGRSSLGSTDTERLANVFFGAAKEENDKKPPDQRLSDVMLLSKAWSDAVKLARGDREMDRLYKRLAELEKQLQNPLASEPEKEALSLQIQQINDQLKGGTPAPAPAPAPAPSSTPRSPFRDRMEQLRQQR